MSKLLTRVEAAIFLGVGVELIDWFVTKCPKPHGDRTLPVAKDSEDHGPLFSQGDLIAFANYLKEPWPKPPKGPRPNIPEQIKEDIKRESHLGCAICGLMVKGEVAHIEAVADTLNNSPENLIYLCPNHHTEYDYGFKPASNVTLEEVRAAKLIRQNSRRRMLRFEANATQTLMSILKLAKHAEKALKEEPRDAVRLAYTSDLRSLLNQVPSLLEQAEKQATGDQGIEDIRNAVLAQAPALSRYTMGLSENSTERDVRESVSQMAHAAEEILLDLDEVECPHCVGSGITGLVGDYCSYCKGHSVVSEQEADEYDPDKLDEVRCPRCNGAGQTGLVGDYCAYCGGSCVVTKREAGQYNPAKIDEVECPHCGGHGTVGRAQTYCQYCHGSCLVPRRMAKEYDRDEIDEVECPHCHGGGQTGLVGDFCAYCGGDGYVSHARADAYDEETLDEVACPHCNGSGKKGLSESFCAYCGGSCVVSKQEAGEYDPEKIDEEQCPHCEGGGKITFAEFCPVCDGAGVLSHKEVRRYERDQARKMECPHCKGNGLVGRHDEICRLCRGTRVVSEDVHDAYLRRKRGG